MGRKDVLFKPYKKITEQVESPGVLPDSWKETTITLIHKANTDPKEIKNYRPISLLNTDYKIYATILATRVKKVLNDVIHQDQSGFLPKRYMRNNVK